MKIRSHGNTEKVEAPMAAMIDVVFQLLIFFMLTLKIIAPEGNFNINMPIVAPSEANPDEPLLPDIKVRLEADLAGNLTALKLGSRNLGTGRAAFETLNSEILKIIGRPGNPLTKDIEVEIDPDFELHYRYIVQAVSKCTGRRDPTTDQVIRYVEKIKFAAPRPPKA